MTRDDEYESEWIEVPTTGPGAVPDDTLGRHLLRRGAGTVPSDLAATIATRIADTSQESGWRRAVRTLRPVAAIAAVLVVVLVGSLIAIAPRPAPDLGPGATTLDPATRALTVAELVRYVDDRPVIGATVILADDILPFPIDCPSAEQCPFGVLRGFSAATNSTDAPSRVYPASRAATPIHTQVDGPVALRIRSGGGFTYLGRVAPASSTRLAWTVPSAEASVSVGDLALVHGWLGMSSVEPPCVPQLSPEPMPMSVDGGGLDFTCGRVSFISVSAASDDTTIPSDAHRVQNQAYGTFAGTPPDDGSSPVALREGDYLVREAVPQLACPSGPTLCGDVLPAPDGWELISRLDPVRIPAATAATPSPTSTPTPADATWDPTQRPLTPPEFLRILGSHPAPGTVLIVDDQVMQSAIDCATTVDCPTGALVNAAGTLVEPPPGGILPFTTDGSVIQPIPGPIALQVTDGPYLVFLGTVVSGGQPMAVSAHDLAARNATGGLFVIPGWIVAGLQPSCPTMQSASAAPTSELGLPEPYFVCVASGWITDTEYQPDTVIDNGASTQVEVRAPTEGLWVQAGAYQAYAPDPADDGYGGTLPRQGTFLVRDWAGRAEVLARLEPRAIPTDATTPTPGIDATPTPIVTPAPSQQPTDSGPASPVGTIVWSKDDLVRRATAGTIPTGTIVVADLQESDFTSFWPPGADHSCPQHCPQWNLTATDGSKLPVLVSMLSPVPYAHVGRIAFLVEGNSLRLLGPVDAQPDGHPHDVNGQPAKAGEYVAVHGWLRDGLPVPCPAEPSPVPVLGLDQASLSYTCPGTWIQPTPAEPATTNADGSGTVGMPVGAALVQDGADGSNQTAREGTFLIRRIDCFYPALDGCQAILDRLDRAELIGEVTAPDQ